MIGTVNLLAIKNHQMANRQYAIGNLLSKKVRTFTGIKYTGNIVQNIQLPWWDDMGPINMVEIAGKYYDILDYDNTTQSERSITLTIQLNPVSTYLANGAAIGGYWERTPKKINLGATMLSPAPDASKLSRWFYLSQIESDYHYPQPYYIQITAKYDIMMADSSTLGLYCTLAPYFPDVLTRTTDITFNALDGFGSHPLLNLIQVITDLDTLTNIPADSIVDVSISPRCPWAFKFNGGTSYSMLNGSNTVPVQGPVSGKTATFWQLKNSGMSWKDDNALDFTVSLTDYERFCGRITLVDGKGQEVVQIPNEYFNGNNELDLTIRSVADLGGVYTTVMFNNMVYTMTEGHLPWVGSAWTEYQIRNLEYDRQAATQGMNTLNETRNINNVAGFENQLISSTLGVATNPVGAVAGMASFGIGVDANNKLTELAQRNIYADQNRREAQMRNSPSPAGQTGHGLDYCLKQFQMGGAMVRVETPANFSEADFSNYVAYNGYPCGKYANLNISPGYLKGNIFALPYTDSPNNGPGPELDALRREVAAGVKLILP